MPVAAAATLLVIQLIAGPLAISGGVVGSASAPRYTGEQFDDDRNQFLLRAAAITDARASWIPRRGMDVFVALENVLDADQEVGRTPLRTAGLPRTARLGGASAPSCGGDHGANRSTHGL